MCVEILSNGVAVIKGDTHFAPWVKVHDSIVTDQWMAEQVCKHVKRGQTVINGGANIGTLAKPLIDAGAIVVAFEPNPAAFKCLKHNCSKAICVPMGLSDRWQELKFSVQDNAGASHFSPSGTIEIETTWLDAWGLNPSLILLDVEGYELKTLKGAAETIMEHKPVLILEVNKGALERSGDSDAALFEYIKSIGYDFNVMQDNCKIGDDQYDIECHYCYQGSVY